MLSGSSFFQFVVGRPVIGFLSLYERENMEYHGAFLITNYNGIPLEFRCTHPIVPDAIQRALYGKGLLEYLGVEICGRPLIQSAKHKPKLIFVEQLFLLNLDDHVSSPIIFVREIKEEDPSSLLNLNYLYQSDIVKPVQQDGNPLQIARKDVIESKTMAFITQLYNEFNFIEPFDRMRQAIQNLHQLNPSSP